MAANAASGLTKDEQRALRVGLELRDQLGGHHFLQAELGTGLWKCRDCNVGGVNGVVVEQRAWAEWVRLCLAVPDSVREILYRPACGVVAKRGAER